ncbi:MAG: C/D box methylation guide ribonucleoprotein complex aNOP56 subunit [Promethearchaeota archaeon]
MKGYIVDTLEGIFALDEGGNIVNFRDFNDDYQKVIKFYESIDNGIFLKEYEDLLLELKNSGFDEFIFDNKDLELLTAQNLDLRTNLERSSLEFKDFRFNLEDQIKKIGISKNRNDILAKYKKINEELIKKKVSEAGGQIDIIITQVIETLDIIKKSISLFTNRLREWYGLHFPELTDKVIEDNILLARMVAVLGVRDNYTFEKINKDFNLHEDQIEVFVKKASESMGADIDLNPIKSYANQILSLDSYRQELEDYLSNLMEKFAPNLNSIVGALIGAKLISKAGGLKKLAYMPASRIQILGAEKALYRFLKTGEKRPKHGLIFQWRQIRGVKPWIRGKISRIIAGKLGLASKIDYFSGDFVGDIFSKEIEEKIKELEEKYPYPPKKIEIKKPKKKKKGKKKSK